MSVAAAQTTHSENHCGCDFCSSRRTVNAKKLAVSQAITQRSGGCNCECHRKGQQTGTGRAFNPDYPTPVNQTALNAARGRTTAKNGNRAKDASGNNDGAPETAEQRIARETEELEALERLLIFEYKARTRAAVKAQQLQAMSAGGKAELSGPQPPPEGYTTGGAAPAEDNFGFSGGSTGMKSATVHEAYEAAQQCAVPPPVQCHASHKLQDTMEDVRQVTRDPVNTQNRRLLQQVLYEHGMGPAPANESASGTRSGAEENCFGSSLAQISTNNVHPRGAGVVWAASTPRQSVERKDVDVLTVEGSAVLGTLAKRPPPLSPSATGTAVVAARA